MTPDDVNALSNDNYTALHEAARWGHARVCGALIQVGARLDIADAAGFTPPKLAQRFHVADKNLHALLSVNARGRLPGTVCTYCDDTPESALLYCARCRDTAYCCPRCARADWPVHSRVYQLARHSTSKTRKQIPQPRCPAKATGRAPARTERPHRLSCGCGGRESSTPAARPLRRR